MSEDMSLEAQMIKEKERGDIRVALCLLKKGYPKEDVIEAIREGADDKEDRFFYATDIVSRAGMQLLSTQSKEIVSSPGLRRMTQVEINAVLGALKWEEKTEKWKMDLSNCDLSGLDLSGKRLDHVNFNNANLSGANLTNCFISFAEGEKVNFENAIMTGVCIYGSNFKKSMLANAALDNAQLSGANFVECNLSHVSLKGAKIEAGSFDLSNLSHSTFEDADITSSTFVRVIKENTNVAGVHLKYSSGLCDDLVEKYEPIVGMIQQVNEEGYSLGVAYKEYEQHLEMFKIATNADVTPEIDFRIARAMREQGFAREQIEQVISDKSPCVAKHENYAFEIANKTEVDYYEGRLQLKNFGVFEPVAREKGINSTAEKEYLDHLELFKKATKSEVSPEVDEKFAKVMLIQGFDRKEVAASIINRSPCVPSRDDDAREYGRDIVKAAEKKLKNYIKDKNANNER